MSKESAEINKKIEKDKKLYSACENAVLNLQNIENSIELLRKETRKIYQEPLTWKENAGETIKMVNADIKSLKAEIMNIASETSDEINELERSLS